jgi:hypothetical protein
MKLITLVSISLLLSSCYAYKNLTKDESVTQDFLSTLKPGKYQFEFKTGLIQFVEITRVDADTIVGFSSQLGTNVDKVSYSSSFEMIEKNVAEISHYEFSKKRMIFGIIVFASIQYVVILSWLFGGW